MYGLSATGLSAAPFAAGHKAENSDLVLITKKPRYGGGWRNVGAPRFFENCWWQMQKRKGRGGFESRWTKKSCPDLRRRTTRMKSQNLKRHFSR